MNPYDSPQPVLDEPAAKTISLAEQVGTIITVIWLVFFVGSVGYFQLWSLMLLFEWLERRHRRGEPVVSMPVDTVAFVLMIPAYALFWCIVLRPLVEYYTTVIRQFATVIWLEGLWLI